MRVDYYLNRRARERIDTLPSASERALAFHRSLPGYVATPVHSCDGLARRLGVAQVWVKEESNRFGLPAYKALGASWAIFESLRQLLGMRGWDPTAEELRDELDGTGLTLVTATDGNHGRAVARVAGWFGLHAEVYVPAEMAAPRIAALRREGAGVREVPGSYDDAVREAAISAGGERLLIQDTAWQGYEQVPTWIVEGYGTIFSELEEQLPSTEGQGPDLVLVQIGVGSLAAAATLHFHSRPKRPRLVGVEPVGAHCLLASARAGDSVTVPGPHRSRMSGLNCGTPSATALPILLQGMDAFLTVDDERAFEAMRLLAGEGVVAGESGAAGLAGLLEISESPELAGALGVGESSRVLLLVTEADTDPNAFREVVGMKAETVRRLRSG